MKKERTIYTVTGKTGRGKSYLIEHWLIKNLAVKMPVIIADSQAEYEAGQQYEGFDHFWQTLKESKTLENVIYTVNIKSDYDAQALFAFSNNIQEKHCLVVEEASKFCSPWSIDDNLNDIVKFGRHDGVSIVFSAQRFAQLHKICTSQTDIFITFQQNEVNDLKAISNYFNDTDKVKNLDLKEFVIFGDVPKDSKIEVQQVLTYNHKKEKIEVLQ